MTNLPDLIEGVVKPSFHVKGPGWDARVRLLTLRGPDRRQRELGMRSLFLDGNPRDAGGENDVLVPRTVLAVCSVRDLTVDLEEMTRWPTQDSTGYSEPGLSDQVAEQDLAGLVTEHPDHVFLLLGIDVEGWDPSRSEWPDAVCLGGRIDLKKVDRLKIDGVGGGALVAALFRAIGLSAPGDEPAKAGLWADGAGLLFRGASDLPWQEDKLPGWFRLAPASPPSRQRSAGPVSLGLSLAPERSESAERKDWSSAWDELRGALLGRPLERPAWLGLEIAQDLPALFWPIALSGARPSRQDLLIDPRQVSVVLRDRDRDPERPESGPRTLARIPAESISLRRIPETGGLRFSVTSGLEPNGEKLAITAGREQGKWQDSMKLEGFPLAFDPVWLPDALRRDQGLAPPSVIEGDTDTHGETGQTLRFREFHDQPLLWAFMPLDTGWAQLPVPNLTEAVYPPPADEGGGSATIPDAAPGNTLLGAVLFSGGEAGTPRPGESPWSLALTAAAAAEATWELSSELALTRADIVLSRPQIALDRLFWLSTGRPRPQDALPDLEDWVGGLRSVPLKSIAGFRNPPVVRLAVDLRLEPNPEAGPGPSREQDVRVGDWSFRYGVDKDTFDRFAKVLPEDCFSRLPALLWLRHPTLPTIQALPLTQSRVPANHPSASRSLAPFELPLDAENDLPRDWRFDCPTGQAHASWPRYKGTLTAERQWRDTGDALGEAILSLPGAALLPSGREGQSRAGLLDLQYRHDLPYTDELHALVSLEPIASAGPEDTRLQALTRASYGAHWKGLAERSALAALAARESMRENGPDHGVANLVEPYRWPVTMTLDQSGYPGSLRFSDSAGNGLDLKGAKALEGFSGGFRRTGDCEIALDDSGELRVTAGSMRGLLEDGGLRDQRGLWRGITKREPETASILAAEVELEGQGVFDLLTLVRPEEITVAGAPWRFWFRDLPTRFDGERFRFDRDSSVGSPHRQDVNDPDTDSREQSHLQGYEWRLGPEVLRSGDEGGGFEPLPINGLLFFPLAVQHLECTGDTLERVVFNGRLQLPLADDKREQTGGSNRVWVDFSRRGGQLVIVNVAAEWQGQDKDTSRSWPLSDESAQANDGSAPRIEWQTLTWNESDRSLSIPDPMLNYRLFGKRRLHRLESLRFLASGAIEVTTRTDTTGEPDAEVSLGKPDLVLDEGGAHRLIAKLLIRLKRTFETEIASPPEPPLIHEVEKGESLWRIARHHYGDGRLWPRIYQANRDLIGPDPNLIHPGQRLVIPFPPQPGRARRATDTLSLLRMDVPLALLPAADSPAGTAKLWGLDARGLELGLSRDEGALQARWDGLDTSTGTTPEDRLRLLPGMELADRDAPGYAALRFSPDLALLGVTLELLLPCSWGEFLDNKATLSTEQLFRSSAGDLDCCYSARYQGTGSAWEDSLLASGMLEVNGLVSWPEDAAPDADRNRVTIPGIEAPGLGHTRHLARILLNQHRLPLDRLMGGGERLLLNLQPLASWQFLALVEHRLLDIADTDGHGNWQVTAERSWSAIQEVRLLRGGFFHEALERMAQKDLKALDPSGRLFSLEDTESGWYGKDLSAALRPALADLPQEVLLVEASAPFWVRRTPLKGELSAVEPLQRLPAGAQTCRPSHPGQYAPVPGSGGWLLLPLPFLGRLHGEPTTAAGDPSVNPLLVDPMELLLDSGRRSFPPLSLHLSHRRAGTARSVTFFPMDSAAARLFPELDPASLASSWLRIQSPPEETANPTGCIMSNLAAGPGRLSRQAALDQLFAPCRNGSGTRPVPAEGPSADASELEWRPDALLAYTQIGLLDGDRRPVRLAGWHAVMLHLAELGDDDGIHPAATLLPGRCDFHQGEEGRPSSPQGLAASPYSSIGFERSPVPSDIPASVFAELLCQKGGEDVLTPIATRRWEPDFSESESSESVLSKLQDGIRSWAAGIHQRLAPASRLAVVRLRQVHKANDGVAIRYGFSLVKGLKIPPAMERRAPPLRAVPARLHFREGQFGGQIIPQALHQIQLTAPLITDPAPLYCQKDKSSPWGLSAFGVRIRYTDGDDAILDTNASRWWQSLQYRTQYRSGAAVVEPCAPPPDTEVPPTGGLPPSFRAPAIRGFLSAATGLKLPSRRKSSPEPTGGDTTGLEAVVPGSVRILLVGERPGSMAALRSTLVRQSTEHPDDWVTSSSIPLQHRIPRPVELPTNLDADSALQPWASRFEPQTNALVTSSPADEAYFAPCRIAYSITQESIDAYLAGGLGKQEANAILEQVTGRSFVGLKVFENELERVLGQSATKHRSLLLRHAQRTYGAGPADGIRIALASPLRGEIDDGWDGRLRFYVSTWNGRGIRIQTASDDAQRQELVTAFKTDYENSPTSPVILILGVDAPEMKWNIVSINYPDLFTEKTLEPNESPEGILTKRLIEKLEQAARPEDIQMDDVRVLAETVSGYTQSRVRSCTMTVSGTSYDFDGKTPVIHDEGEAAVEYKVRESMSEALHYAFSQIETGRDILVRVSVASGDTEEPFTQVLEFPLRRRRADQPRLPLLPTFVHFEDPEYNRKLATPTSHKSTSKKAADDRIYRVRLATDRREYSPGDTLTLRYDWDDEHLAGNGSLQVRLVRDGINRGEQILNELLQPQRLRAVPLNTLDDSPRPGDTLEVTLTALRMVKTETEEKEEQLKASLILEITDHAKTPPPDSAYALLRGRAGATEQTLSMECTRFAWSPAPVRVDMVCPTDLHTDLVRRRAVFHWQNSERAPEQSPHFIQKVTQSGSTHFLTTEMPER